MHEHAPPAGLDLRHELAEQRGEPPKHRKWVNEHANDVDVDATKLAAFVDPIRAKLRSSGDAELRAMSAELSGVGATLDRYAPNELVHVLVHTDTALGKQCATLVQESLGGSTIPMTAGGLRTDDLTSFRAALADLTKQLDELVQSYRDKGWFVVFNLTAGFKSLNGYLQTLAMITADRCVYLFESAQQLMEIPRLPVQLAETEELRAHVDVFRRLDVGYLVAAADAMGIPDVFVMEIDGKITTSTLGDVAWARHRTTLLAEKLLPPLSTKVTIRPDVNTAFDKLEAAQKRHVNEALDEFSAYLDHKRPLLKSRTFKKLEGNPVPGSTHELYAWSDGAAGRLFGHFDGDNFVFDTLTKHLC